MMLKNKVAVIYGAGGAIGGAVARAFAAEGAKLFVTGRLPSPVDALARDIVSAGASAEAAAIDALDEQAVDKHLQSVIDKARRVDISFNRARTSGHPRSRSATTRHTGDQHNEGGLRHQIQGIGRDLGAVPSLPRRHEPHATGHDARGGRKHGGLHGFR